MFIPIFQTERRVRQQPKFQLEHLDRTADVKKVFSKAHSTNWSYILYTIIEVLWNTIPSYRLNYLPEKCNENL